MDFLLLETASGLRSSGLSVKCLNYGLFLTNTQLLSSPDGLEWCGLLVYYCDVLSAVWTLILTAPIHCRASVGEQVM